MPVGRYPIIGAPFRESEGVLYALVHLDLGIRPTVAEGLSKLLDDFQRRPMIMFRAGEVEFSLGRRPRPVRTLRIVAD